MSNLQNVLNEDYSKAKFSFDLNIEECLSLSEYLTKTSNFDKTNIGGSFLTFKECEISLEHLVQDDGYQFVRVAFWDKKTDISEDKDE